MELKVSCKPTTTILVSIQLALLLNQIQDFQLKCRHAKYCSRKCQLTHWKAGHKQDCPGLEKQKDKAIKVNQRYIETHIKEGSAKCSNPKCYRVREKSKLKSVRNANRQCIAPKNAKYRTGEVGIDRSAVLHLARDIQGIF